MRLLLSLLLVTVAGRAVSGEALVDLEVAFARAREQKKPVFVEFTGSDWCVPCIKFEQNVMADEGFARFLSRRFVAVRLDIPYRKKIDPAVKKRNEELAGKYAVKIYPTFLVLDAAGREIGRREGYLGEAPAEFQKIVTALVQSPGR